MILDRITSEPTKMNGQPCIRGLRLTVRRLLQLLALYPDRAELRKEFPDVEEEDIRQALIFAAASLDDRVIEKDPAMKLLLDQGLPSSLAAIMIERGVETVHVSQVDLAAANDPTILAFAHQNAFFVVTFDADFHTLLALSQSAGPSVIRIRIEGLKAPALAILLENVLKDCAAELEKGAMVTIQPDRFRIRLLPLLRPE